MLNSLDDFNDYQLERTVSPSPNVMAQKQTEPPSLDSTVKVHDEHRPGDDRIEVRDGGNLESSKAPEKGSS